MTKIDQNRQKVSCHLFQSKHMTNRYIAKVEGGEFGSSWKYYLFWSIFGEDAKISVWRVIFVDLKSWLHSGNFISPVSRTNKPTNQPNNQPTKQPTNRPTEITSNFTAGPWISSKVNRRLFLQLPYAFCEMAW